MVAPSPCHTTRTCRVSHPAFRKVKPTGGGGLICRSPQGLRHSSGYRFGFTVFRTCRAQPRLIGWRHATRESDVLLLTLTAWAFLTSVSNTPAADFCGRVTVNYSALSHESERVPRSPAISSAAFDTRPPDLPPASLRDTDFVVIWRLV